MKKRTNVLIVAAAFIVFLTSCSQSPKQKQETVKIAYLPITHALALFETAEELESKDGLKVELVKYGSWPELLDALNANRVDGASVLIELAMKSKQELSLIHI